MPRVCTCMLPAPTCAVHGGCVCMYICMLHVYMCTCYMCLHIRVCVPLSSCTHIWFMCLCTHACYIGACTLHVLYCICLCVHTQVICVCTYMLHVPDMWQSCTLRGGRLGEQGRQVPCQFSQPHCWGKASPFLGCVHHPERAPHCWVS